MNTREPKGFVALITVVIISTILLSLSASVSTNTFFARFNGMNREFKKISRELAEACVHTALAKIGSDYTYRTVTDPEYSSSLGGVRVLLGSIYDKDVECVITSPASTPPEVNGKRTFPITTRASYGGAFSTMTVLASAQNPEEAPSTPPPTCALSVTPASVPLGEQVTLTWSVSGNATGMTINQGIGSVNPLQTSAPWPTNTPTGIGSKTFTATVSNSSGNTTCSDSVSITAPPPSPACADTVMMLDRSYSMFGWPNYPSGSTQWIPNEKAAGKALVDLYSLADGSPKVSFGRIADLSTGRGADIQTQLTSNYAAIKSAIDNGLPSNPIGYTNLGEAIRVAHAELNSIRHEADNEKVLIFVSDGEPNEPSGSFTASTSRQLPTAHVANTLTDFWNTPSGAYQTGVATSSTPRSHQYRDFNFNLPSGATIRGIEVQATAQSSVASTQTVLNETFGTGSSLNDIPNWEEEGTESDATTLAMTPTSSGNDTASLGGGRFARIGQDEWICRSFSAAGLSNLALSFESRGDTDANSNNDVFIVEYNTSDACGGGSTPWVTSSSVSLTQNRNSWVGQTLSLPSVLNNDSSFSIRFRVDSNSSSETGRVDSIVLTGQPPLCSLAFDLSHNSGSSWTSKKNQILSSSLQTYSLGGATDTWGRTWNLSEFGNSNFRLRIGNTTTGPLCSVDTLTTRVHYSTTVDPTQYAIDMANAAKNDNVKIFSIHFGSTGGQNLMSTLSSDSPFAPTSITSATRSGSTATIVTAQVHRLTVNQRARVTGVSNSAYNGTFTVTSVPTPNSFTYTTSSGSTAGSGGSVAGTNLFISPSSGAMNTIFQSIGYQVCPAAAPECSNGIDDDRDGQIDTSDSACHTDDNASNAASYDAQDEDEWSDPTPPEPPAPPPPPTNIIIESWIETP